MGVEFLGSNKKEIKKKKRCFLFSKRDDNLYHMGFFSSLVHWMSSFAIPLAIVTILFAEDTLHFKYLIFNTSWQAIAFFCLASVPAFITERMSYLEIAWPVGLILMGGFGFLLGNGLLLRKLIISYEYVVLGGRLAMSGFMKWKMGHLDRELPKYLYQRLHWQKREEFPSLSIQLEILLHFAVSISYLPIPLLLQAFNPTPIFSFLELAGHFVWVGGWIIEWVSDAQKLRFLRTRREEGEAGQSVCDIGLWKYSRHPNYFGTWLIWVGFFVSSIPSFIFAAPFFIRPVQLALIGGLIQMVVFMYWCLVHYKGAVPAEHFLRKKENYQQYQQKTNMFFPNFPVMIYDFFK